MERKRLCRYCQTNLNRSPSAGLSASSLVSINLRLASRFEHLRRFGNPRGRGRSFCGIACEDRARRNPGHSPARPGRPTNGRAWAAPRRSLSPDGFRSPRTSAEVRVWRRRSLPTIRPAECPTVLKSSSESRAASVGASNHFTYSYPSRDGRTRRLSNRKFDPTFGDVS